MFWELCCQERVQAATGAGLGMADRRGGEASLAKFLRCLVKMAGKWLTIGMEAAYLVR